MNSRSNANVINLKELKNGKYLGELWEYPDCYEYCIISNYEDKFPELRTESIQMDECFATLINNGDHYVLISIMFDKNGRFPQLLIG